MAKLPALVTALSEMDGRDRKAVDHIARTIRECGYITTGKRGSGAAEMTPHEAANLLIALNGADLPKEGPIAIDRFRSLRQHAVIGHGKPGSVQLEKYDDYPQAIKNVMNVHTFGEALDSLIEDVPDLVACLRQYFHIAYNDLLPADLDKLFLGSLRLKLFGIEITFQRYFAKIELYTMNGSDRRLEFQAKYIQDPDRIESGFYGKQWPDRTVSIAIGTPTLIAAWQALHPGESLPGIPDRLPSSEDAAEASNE